MWFWGIISGLWFGRTRKPEKNPKRPFQVGNIVSVIVGVVAIGLSCFFASQAEKSTKRVESLVEAGLYPANEEFAKDMDLDISKIEDPLLFAQICIANKKGDRKGLKSRLEEYLEIAPESGYPYWLFGIYFSDQETTIVDDADSAIYFYTKAIDLMEDTDVNRAMAFNNRGIVFKEKGDYDKAMNDYQSAIILNPLIPEPYNNLGNLKIEQNEDSIAIWFLDIAIFLNPIFTNAYFNRSLANRNLGNYKKAIEDLDMTISLKPDFTEAYYNRALNKDSNGDYKGAISDYNIALKLDPKNSNAYLGRGLVFNRLNENEKAMADYNTAIDLDSTNPNAFNNRGSLKGKILDFEGAINDFNQAIELDSNYVSAFFNRGCTYLRYSLNKGINPKESEHYEKAISDIERGFNYKNKINEYNIACARALLLEKEAAYEHLVEALARKLVTAKQVIDDRDWDHIREEPEYKRIIAKYEANQSGGEDSSGE